MAADPVTGHNRFTPDEIAAVQKVAAVEAERAMSIGSNAAGGFAVPFTLDPSVQLTSSGQTNPLRQLARVVPITTGSWKGISSLGVTASWDPEGTEVSDDSPTFAQPVADVRIIKIENAVAQNMREHGCCAVSALDFHLEHAAIGAILRLDFHRKARTGACKNERFGPSC